MSNFTILLLVGALFIGVLMLWLGRSRVVSSSSSYEISNSSYETSNSASSNSELMHLISTGRKIQAIKRVRQQTGLGLKEAKDYVDALEQGIAPAVNISQPTVMPSGSWEQEVRDLVQRNQKIQAIKRVRQHTGLGLKEAKDYVDRL